MNEAKYYDSDDMNEAKYARWSEEPKWEKLSERHKEESVRWRAFRGACANYEAQRSALETQLLKSAAEWIDFATQYSADLESNGLLIDSLMHKKSRADELEMVFPLAKQALAGKHEAVAALRSRG